MGIFKAYDIRGVYGTDLNEALAYRIGRASALSVKPKKVVVGCDVRVSSPSLKKELIRGLLDSGCDVTDTGVCTTPMLHHISHGFELGINVTASHNDKEYNGFKLYAKGIPINADTGLKKIEELVVKDSFPAKKKGSLHETDLRQEYMDRLILQGKGDYGQAMFVVDVSNGAAGFALQKVFSALKVKVVFINEKPDGNFPCHSPNPLKTESHKQLAAAILKAKAMGGCVLDGDGDRTIFLDENGNEASQEGVKILIAEHYLKSHPKSHFVFDLITSRNVKEFIEKNGGFAHFERVGYSFIYHRLTKETAIFGAEVSAHSFYRELEYNDSGIFTILKVMQILKEKGRPFSAVVNEHLTYIRSGELNYTVSDKEKVMAAIETAFKKGKIDHLDGVSIDLGDVWFNVRPSNTESLLRLRIEGRSKQGVDAVKQQIEKLIKS